MNEYTYCHLHYCTISLLAFSFPLIHCIYYINLKSVCHSCQHTCFQSNALWFESTSDWSFNTISGSSNLWVPVLKGKQITVGLAVVVTQLFKFPFFFHPLKIHLPKNCFFSILLIIVSFISIFFNQPS